MLQTFALTVLGIFLGMVVGKLVSAYVIAPTGIPIASGDPTSQGRVAA